jgi:serine/threonine protein kinase
MTERWHQVETLYHEALEQDSGARAAFLSQACAGDEELLREVETLLSYDKRAKGFIERPAFELAAKAIAAETPAEELSEEANQLPPPRQIGPYQLLSLLGKGGMGEVHLALDTRLNRKVAIKLLPAEFTADAERVRRFEQEARAISALNHPNIVTVYEIGETEGRHYIVTEYVEGETLRQRMESAPQHQMRLKEVLEIAAQVASALQSAHEAGIIHRDVKPENVMVRQSGLVKVLDFGLAKISQMQTKSQFPERVSTQTGIVLGTVTYMSPEQARGNKVDYRTDIFSLGVILYQMLVGRKPFEGPTTSDVIVALLTKDPVPLRELAPDVPAALQAIVSRCLEKQPEKRFQSAGDLGFALAALSAPAQAVPETTAPPSIEVSKAASRWVSHLKQGWLGRILVAATAALFLAALALAVIHLQEQPEEKLAAAFTFTVPEGWKFRWFDAPAVSPDGKSIVFSAVPSSEQAGRTVSLWMRSLDTNEAKILPGTEGGISPFWSPDGRFIAFWANGKLKKLETGGSPVTICETGPMLTGTWNRDGVILFTSGTSGRLLNRVAATGGRAVALQPFADGEVEQQSPRFLPDGRRFLYYSRNRDSKDDGLYVASLDSGANRKPVLKEREIIAASYVSPGYLLFIKGEMLMAQHFNLQRLELEGDPVLIAEQAASYTYYNPEAPFAAFSASENGVLTWKVKTIETPATQLTWFDRAGKRLGTLGETASYSGPALSPDEKRLVVGRWDPRAKSRDLWIMDLFGGAGSRLTFEPTDDLNPVWTPDGKWIIFTSGPQGKRRIYRKLVDGIGQMEPMLEVEGDQNVEDLSPDGRFLIFNSRAFQQEGPDLSLLSLTPERKVTSLLTTPTREDQALFSPDGRWVAYRSYESGDSEIYVRSFTPNGNGAVSKWRISEGGSQPRWRGDGKELFYLRGNILMAVDVKTDGNAFSAGAPRRLFSVNIEPEERRNRYVVTKDGQRFLVITLTEATGGSTIAVRLNWMSALSR